MQTWFTLLLFVYLPPNHRELNLFCNMKKLLFVFAAVAAVFAFVSCDKSLSEQLKAEYLPFKTDDKDAWGLLGKDGKPLFKDEFDGEISPSINGVFAVETKNGISLYRTSDKPELIKGCENLKAVGMMNEGLIPIVRKGQRIEYVDKDGKTKFVLNPYKNKEIVSASIFIDGLAAIGTDDEKYGFIDAKGKVLIEPKYSYVSVFNEGLCLVQKIEKNKDTLMVIINKDGKEVKKLPKDISIESTIFEEGKLYAKIGTGENRRCAFFDAKGEIMRKLPKKVKWVSDYQGDYYIYNDEEGNKGVNNMKDETIIRAKYESMEFVGKKTFLVEKGDKWNLIDDEDNVIKTFEDYTIMRYSDDWECLLGTDSDGKMELLNIKGEKISNEAFILGKSFYPCASGVNSDYFDVAATAEKLANCISDNGIGKIKLGDSMQQWLDSDKPALYREKNTAAVYPFMAELENINKCQLFLQVSSKNPITIEKYSTEYYYGYSFRSFNGYGFNPKANVNAVSLFLQLDTEDKVKDVESLVSALRDKLIKKGYRVSKQGTFGCELSKGNNTLVVAPLIADNEPALIMELMHTSNRTMIKSLEQIESLYKQDKERYKDRENQEVEEPFPCEIGVETATEEVEVAEVPVM